MKLKRIIVKEVKELLKERTVLLGMILGPIIIFLIFAGMSIAAGQQALEQAVQVRNFAIVYTGSNYAEYAAKLAKVLHVQLYNGSVDVDEVLGRHVAVIIVDDEFFENITSGLRGVIDMIVRTDSLNFLSMSLPQQVEMTFSQGVYFLLSDMLRTFLPNVNEDFLRSPVTANTVLYYRGMEFTAAEAFSLVFGVGLSVTMATMILVMSSMQVAATSIGIERESKTLEMLLSLPVSRRELILGKIMGVSLITGLGIISYAIGISIYFYSLGLLVEQAPQQGAQQVQELQTPFTIGVFEIVVFIAGLAATLLTSLLIGMIVGAIPQDVRGAQLASSYVGLLLLAPVFAVFFGVDITSLSGIWSVVYLDPVVLLYLVIWGVVISDNMLVLTGFVGLILHLVVWLLLASKMITSEAILLGGYSSRISRVFRRRAPSQRDAF